jgi:diguanylate cyclase (GGDEF)-like protein
MAFDMLINKQLTKNKNFNAAVALRDALEYTSDFDFRSHRKLLKSALSTADNLRHHQDSMVQALGTTLSALQHASAELEAAQKRIAELEELATTDELTGLTNRRGFYDMFAKEIDRTNRGMSAGGLLIMIDLDNFKMINDTYGHAAGDEALKLVAKTLKEHIRTMDVASRLGGDEFVLLFANAGATKALGRAQNLAVKLNSLTLRHQGQNIPVRASIGVHDYRQGDSVDEAFEKADATMYKAKEDARKEEGKTCT